jgi:Family of unknown function (DUF5675)
MKILVERDTFTPLSTTGKLSIDGAFFCYTLEPVRRIPAGTYAALVELSPKWTTLRKYPFLVPLLQDVPGFTAIEIHIGNFPKDTEGCTLVGLDRSADAVLQSEDAFFQMMHRIAGALAAGETLTVEYTETAAP